MHPVLTATIVKEVRQRSAEGDCPAVPAHSVGQLEDAILDLSGRFERLQTALRRIVSLEEKNVPKYAQQIARDALAR